MRTELMVLSSLTLSKAKDNGARSLENPNGNFPSPQDFHNLDADYGLSGYDQPLQQHHELRLAAAVRPRARAGATGRSPASTRSRPASR